MTVKQDFELRVRDVFQFANGQTVFVGPVEGSSSYVGPQTCELLVDGARRQVLQLEGEMLPDPRRDNGYRSVSTKDKVDLSTSDLTDHACILRLVAVV